MRKDIVLIILIAVGLGVLAVSMFGISFNYSPSKTQVSAGNITSSSAPVIESRPSYGGVSINVPAVDSEGNGVLAKLNVQSMPGNGKALVDINQLFFWIDTQYSIRTAKEVAENYTKVDLSKVDLTYSIETNASVIEGQSAGAALTILTVAAIQNKSLKKDVIITGTINPDGTIGPVGSIIAKANAAKDAGATLFLVPNGQGTQVNYKPEQKCEKTGPIVFCTTEYKTEKVDLSKDLGISVKEVSTFDEALKYFISDAQ